MNIDKSVRTLISDDSLSLHYISCIPDTPKGMFVLVHGLGEHSGRYEELFQVACDMHLAVFAMDLRGHGRSEGLRGHMDYFDQVLSDLDMLVVESHKQIQKGPLFLLGHSLGGLIAINYALVYPDKISGLIVVSPALKLAVKVPAYKTKLGELASNFLPRFSMGNEIDPNLLSHDKDVVKNYINDPLVHARISARMYTEMTAAMDRATVNAPHLTIPCLIVHGTADKIVSIDGSKTFFANAGSPDKKSIWYDGMYHECLHETQRKKVFDDLRAWMNSHIA